MIKLPTEQEMAREIRNFVENLSPENKELLASFTNDKTIVPPKETARRYQDLQSMGLLYKEGKRFGLMGKGKAVLVALKAQATRVKS